MDFGLFLLCCRTSSTVKPIILTISMILKNITDGPISIYLLFTYNANPHSNVTSATIAPM